METSAVLLPVLTWLLFLQMELWSNCFLSPNWQAASQGIIRPRNIQQYCQGKNFVGGPHLEHTVQRIERLCEVVTYLGREYASNC